MDQKPTFGIRDLLPWLTAAGIIAAAVAGVVAIRGTTDLLASEIRSMGELFRVEIAHLSDAVTDLKGAVKEQEQTVARVQAAVMSIPRTEQQIRELDGRLREIERSVPSLSRPRSKANGP